MSEFLFSSCTELSGMIFIGCNTEFGWRNTSRQFGSFGTNFQFSSTGTDWLFSRLAVWFVLQLQFRFQVWFVLQHGLCFIGDFHFRSIQFLKSVDSFKLQYIGKPNFGGVRSIMPLFPLPLWLLILGKQDLEFYKTLVCWCWPRWGLGWISQLWPIMQCCWRDSIESNKVQTIGVWIYQCEFFVS
jgi:hypothetical protein